MNVLPALAADIQRNSYFLVRCAASKSKVAHIRLSICLLILLGLPTLAYAQTTQCTDVFSSAVNGSLPTSELIIQRNVTIRNTDTRLNIPITYDAGPRSCNSQACAFSGSLAQSLSLPPFQHTSSTQELNYYQSNLTMSVPQGEYQSVYMGNNGRLTFTQNNTVTKIRQLHLSQNSVLTLSGGIYWIDSVAISNNSRVVIPNGEHVIIYANQIWFDNNVQVNMAGEPENLTVIDYNDMYFSSRIALKGYFYAVDSISYETQDFTGALHASRVYLAPNSQINFDADGVNLANFDTLCSNANSPREPELISYWSADVCPLNQSTLIDVQSNHNGLVGEGATLVANGKACQGVTFSGNDSDVSISHHSDFALESGAVSFWFSYDRIRGEQALVSKDANGYVNGGHLHIFIDSNGLLNVRHQTTNTSKILRTSSSIPTAQWHHVVYSFGAEGNALYVNGQLIDSDTGFTTGLIANQEALVFGASTTRRTSGSNDPGVLRDRLIGSIDEIKLYQNQPTPQDVNNWMNENPSCQTCNAVHHYLIEHPATALICTNPDITIKACANEDCSVLADSISSVELLPRDSWAQSTVAFTGSTATTLQHRQAGTLTLSLADSAPVAPISCSNNCEIEYTEAGFELFHVGSASTNFAALPFVAQSDLNQVGIRAVNSVGEQCTALLQGQHSVALTYSCTASTGVDYTPMICNREFAGVGLSGGAVNSGTIDLTFNSDGETTLAGYTYSDVGELDLTINATINDASIQSGNARLKFIPAQLHIHNTSSAPAVAGQAFTLSISALGANGGHLPGYRPNEFQIGLTRVFPTDVAAVEGRLYLDDIISVTSRAVAGFTAVARPEFTDAGYTSNQAYIDEVGQFSVTVQDQNYLGNVVTSNTLDLGRFIPAYFDVTLPQPPVIADSCGDSFTYVGQAFGFEVGAEPTLNVTAYNARSQITRNYGGSLWTLSPTQASLNALVSFADGTGYPGALQVVSAGDQPTLLNEDVYDGSGYLMITGSELNYAKVATPSGVALNPFVVNIDMIFDAGLLTDADGVCYQQNYPAGCNDLVIEDIAGTEFRYGRLVAENTFGPELNPLTVPLRAEYLMNGQWRVSSTDSCTSINLSQTNNDIALVHDPESPANLASRIDNLYADGWLASGRSAFDDLVIAPVVIDGQAQRGSMFLQLVPRNSTGHWSSYLNIDWDGDGEINSDDKPTSAVSFGQFRGSDKSIHWREVY